MSEIIVVEHEDPVDTDTGIRHLKARGSEARVWRPYLGETMPVLDGRIGGVIVTGGPQMVSDLDRYPYLRNEMAFIGNAMARDLPLLGICLGGQLVAAHLGADVDYHPLGHVALGYYPLNLTEAGKDWFPEDLRVLAGNAQGFEVPEGAVPLAGGDVFPNQAFRYGDRTIAMQFHPEANRAIVDFWKTVIGHNAGKPGAQSLSELDAGFDRHNHRLTEWYRTFLDRLFLTP